MFTWGGLVMFQVFRNIECEFYHGGAYGNAAYVSSWQHLPHRLTGEIEFHLPGFTDSYADSTSRLHQIRGATDGIDS